MTAPAGAWEALQEAAFERGEYAGVPFPREGHALQIDERHPKGAELERVTDCRDIQEQACDVDETLQLRNAWYSDRLRTEVMVYSRVERGRTVYGVTYLPFQRELEGRRRWKMWVDTLHAAVAHDFGAEAAAMQRLAELVTPVQFRQYVSTSCFPETSTRSRVTYIFRRLRPTVALGHASEDSIVPLCALCMHPLGYYRETWAGALVPTDDLIGHLLLMRADEHMFWRRCNQHDLNRIEAGV